MRAKSRRPDWQVVDCDDLPVPAAALNTTPIGTQAQRVARITSDAYRLAADHADVANSTDPDTCTAAETTLLRAARSRAETAVDAARAAQQLLGHAVTGKQGEVWAAGIATGRAVAAHGVADAAQAVIDAASAFDPFDRAQAWHDEATTAAHGDGRWPIGYDAPPRWVVIGSRRYALGDVLAAVRGAYCGTSSSDGTPD